MAIVGLYSQLVAPVGIFAGEFVVLIGLAVAIDYSLFVITRFRTERMRGREKVAAIEVASATAGRAVVFSGLAVMVSLGSVIMIDDPTIQSCAIARSPSLASLAGSLLPATLAILDGASTGSATVHVHRSVARPSWLATIARAAAALWRHRWPRPSCPRGEPPDRRTAPR
jgi:RND superfamily putative drug exporter